MALLQEEVKTIIIVLIEDGHCLFLNTALCMQSGKWCVAHAALSCSGSQGDKNHHQQHYLDYKGQAYILYITRIIKRMYE